MIKLIDDDLYRDQIFNNGRLKYIKKGDLTKFNYLFCSNNIRTQFKKWKKLSSLKTFDFWKYKNIKYISDSEFYHHIKLTKDQFHQQVTFIKKRFDLFLK